MTGGLDRKAYLRLLTAALVSMFLVRVAFGVLLSALPAYLHAEGNTVLGLVSSASPFLEALTIVFAGVFIDRYGHKGILLTGLALAAVSLYGTALTRNVYVVSLVNAIHGIAAAFILVTTLAIIASYAPPGQRGREMGLFNFANVFGYVVGYAAAFVLQDALADRLEYAFVIAGALATAGLLLANRMIDLPREKELVRELHHQASMKDFVAAFRTPRLLLLIVPWLIVFSLVAALVTFLPRVTGSVLQLSGGATAAGILVSGIVFVAAQLFWGRMADLYGRELIMLIGGAGFAALMGVIVYAFVSTHSADPGVVFDAVFARPAILVVLLFIAFAFPPAGLAAIADEAKTGAEGTTMSAYSLTLSLGFIVGPPLVGFISETLGASGMLAFFAASAAGLFALVLTRYVQARIAKPAPVVQEGP